MRKYDSYKDSGVEWIGEIPNSWKNSKLKYSSEITMGQSPSSEFYNDEGVGFPFLQGNSEFGDIHPTHKLTTSEITKKSRRGDILFSVRGSVGEINWSDKEYCIGRGLCSISPIKLESKLLWYLLLFSKEEFLSNSVGSTFVSVNTDDVKNLTIPLPPLPEQQQIVSYLDRKTSQIDSLIEKAQRKIELLKEKRTSLINEVVTKGLNPNVEMKDSGVEWIGEIPSHWEFIPVKYSLLRSKDSIRTGPFGSSLKSDEFIDEGVRVYNQRSVYDEDFSRSEIFVSEEKFEELKSFEVKPLDILITSRGTIGKMTIVPQDGEKGVLHPCLIRLRIDRNKLFDKYLWFYVNQSSLFIESVLNESNSTTIEVIYSDTLSNVKFPLPPLSEQNEIVSYLDEHTQLIDKTISIEEKRIELLKEYRQSLISEVVTGKRKVTND